jgi:hypothetical protein
MEATSRIVFNVTHEYPKEEVMLFAEMLNRLRALDVMWDLHIRSDRPGRKGHHVDRAVELVIYQDEQGNHHDATISVTTWLKSNHLEYRLLSTSIPGQGSGNP